VTSIDYVLEAWPKEPDRYKVYWQRESGRIRRGLQMIEWGDSYFGVDFQSDIEFKLLKDSGRIEVRGKDEGKCREKVAEIQKGLDGLFGHIPYKETTIKNVILEDEVTANEAKIVPGQILRVMQKEMPTYSVRDICFSFTEEAPTTLVKREASIRFEKHEYKRGARLSLKVTVIAPILQMSKQIFEGLRRELEVGNG